MKNKEILKSIMHEIRCPICHSLLLKAKFWGDYTIQTKCTRCKNIVEVTRISKTIDKNVKIPNLTSKD